MRWLGPHFDGVIVLDECHRAKNLYPTSSSMKPSKTGNVILELQRRLVGIYIRIGLKTLTRPIYC